MGKSVKVKSIKEIRKEIGLQTDDRKNFLNTLLNIENNEVSIVLQTKHIQQMKVQVNTTISERDNFGNILTKDQLERRVTIREQELKDMKLKLKYEKETLYFALHSGTGLIDKAGSEEKLKEKVYAHYLMIEEEFEKFKKKLKGDLNVV